MKKRKRKTFLLVILIIMILIFLFLNQKYPNDKFQEELIFFKWFSSGRGEKENTLLSKNQRNQNNQPYPSYRFEVSYKNIDFKDIYLVDTINQNTQVREKIAPGTEGTFEIVLQTNQKINYQIKFKSQNDKPQNLNFQIEGKDRKYTKLEDMEEELKGEMTNNKRIIIHWRWEYQTNKIEDIQDTKDGQKIKQYNFTISAIGE